MDKKTLRSLQEVDIENIQKEKLKDITKFIIGQNEPPIQRLISFTYSMENPYIFRIGKTPVKVVFSKRHGAVSLQKRLENIVCSKII